MIPDNIPVPDFNPELSYLGYPDKDDNGVWFFPVIDYSEEDLKLIEKFKAGLRQSESINSEVETKVIDESNSITDNDVLLEKQDIFPLWQAGLSVKVNEKYQDFEGKELKLWKVIQAHTTQADWRPELVPALFTKVLPDGATKIWEAGIQVIAGAEYQYKETTYIVLQSHTTQVGWEPDKLASLWKLK